MQLLLLWEKEFLRGERKREKKQHGRRPEDVRIAISR